MPAYTAIAAPSFCSSRSSEDALQWTDNHALRRYERVPGRDFHRYNRNQKAANCPKPTPLLRAIHGEPRQAHPRRLIFLSKQPKVTQTV